MPALLVMLGALLARGEAMLKDQVRRQVLLCTESGLQGEAQERASKNKNGSCKRLDSGFVGESQIRRTNGSQQVLTVLHAIPIMPG